MVIVAPLRAVQRRSASLLLKCRQVAGYVVANTLRYRKAVGLPNYFVVLNDRNDAGTVFLDTSSGAVAWVDTHAVSAFAGGLIQAAEYDAYANFSAWVADCVREIKD